MARHSRRPKFDPAAPGIDSAKLMSSPELFEKVLDTLEWRATDSVEDLDRRAEQAAELVRANPAK